MLVTNHRLRPFPECKFDGYPICGSVDQDGSSPTDLDACSGHIGVTADYPDGVYHYHAGLEFPNLPPCLVGVSAKNSFATTASAGIGAAGGWRSWLRWFR